MEEVLTGAYGKEQKYIRMRCIVGIHKWVPGVHLVPPAVASSQTRYKSSAANAVSYVAVLAGLE